MQKWDYCVIGPIKEAKGRWEGYHPNFYSFSTAGLQDLDIPMEKGDQEKDALARQIAKLGDEGWEMVGCGGVNAGDYQSHHYIYFKRPKD
jgi:hypothetical protein